MIGEGRDGRRWVGDEPDGALVQMPGGDALGGLDNGIAEMDRRRGRGVAMVAESL